MTYSHASTSPNPASGNHNSAEPDFFSEQVISARRFFLDLHPSPIEAFAVICGGREHCSADYNVRRDDFRYLSLEFVARGEGTLRINTKEYRLIPGAVFAYGPGIPHEIRSDPEKPLTKYFVDMLGKNARELLIPPAPNPGQIVQTAVPEEILRLFEDLIDAGLRQTPFNKRICISIVEHLVLRIAETAVPLGIVGTEAFETYHRCRDFIERHFREVVDLSQIALACGVDPAYVCRLFKRFDHHGPWQYVIHLKMREAAQRLQGGGKLIKTISEELGFSDPFQFSRTFRRVFGISPRQFLDLQRSPRHDSHEHFRSR